MRTQQTSSIRIYACLAVLVGASSGAGTPLYASDDAASGQSLYITHCSACHQVGGEGLPGVAPPLKGSGVVNKDDASKHIHAVLDGMSGGTVGGVVSPPATAPLARA